MRVGPECDARASDRIPRGQVGKELTWLEDAVHRAEASSFDDRCRYPPAVRIHDVARADDHTNGRRGLEGGNVRGEVPGSHEVVLMEDRHEWSFREGDAAVPVRGESQPLRTHFDPRAIARNGPRDRHRLIVGAVVANKQRVRRALLSEDSANGFG